MVSTDKNINLYVNIGFGSMEPWHADRAMEFVKERKEELYGLENGENLK